MTVRRRQTARPVPLALAVEPLDTRALLTTLIALVDTGVNLANAADAAYYDFTYAYNAVTGQTAAQAGNAVVQDQSLPQHNGHGPNVADQIVAGIIAAESAPGASAADVKIMPVVDSFPTAQNGINIPNTALINGVLWAADHGAAVINLSVESNFDPSINLPNGTPFYLSQAIAYAQSKGAVVVTAAGNGALDAPYPQGPAINVDTQVSYPIYAADPAASNASPPPTNLIVAAALDAAGNLTPESNWGPNHVNLGAPTNATGDTSYAAGYTSGVAGVVDAVLGAYASPTNVVNAVEGSVTPRPQSVGAWSTTGGAINPAGAVAAALGEAGNWSFEFGPRYASPQPGYTEVSNFSWYNPTQGYGWVNGAAIGNVTVRGPVADAAPLTQQFVYGQDLVFRVDLPNGTYNVAPTLGDVHSYGYSYAMDVMLQGRQVDTVVAAPNQVDARGYLATVVDGTLSLEIKGLNQAGTAGFAALDALTITPASTALLYTFGPADAPAAAGYTQVSNFSWYTPSQGFGWQPDAILGNVVDRGPLTNANAVTRDFVYGKNLDFQAALPNGIYTVTPILGDLHSDGYASTMRVTLQGVQVADTLVPQNSVDVSSYTAVVTNGTLTLDVQGLARPGSDGYAKIDGLVINAGPQAR